MGTCFYDFICIQHTTTATAGHGVYVVVSSFVIWAPPCFLYIFTEELGKSCAEGTLLIYAGVVNKLALYDTRFTCFCKAKHDTIFNIIEPFFSLFLFYIDVTVTIRSFEFTVTCIVLIITKVLTYWQCGGLDVSQSFSLQSRTHTLHCKAKHVTFDRWVTSPVPDCHGVWVNWVYWCILAFSFIFMITKDEIWNKLVKEDGIVKDTEGLVVNCCRRY